ncbi:hypothetical protein [Streptomyces sp. 1222.5]|uniref:hypothetical protein n=1 Tax=Streptomyces sp. 1222.5 TaxID=1881026 RepID=UPI003D72F3AB
MYERTGQDVLRDVVRRVAPAELENLDETCRAYAVRPHPPQPLHRPAGDPLGVGIESAVVLPVLVAVVSQVLADLASGRIQAGGTRLKRWWRRRRGADAEARRAALTSAVPELSEVTRQELADWAVAQGRAAGLSATQAATCAQVVVVAVVRGNAPPAEVLDVRSGGAARDERRDRAAATPLDRAAGDAVPPETPEAAAPPRTAADATAPVPGSAPDGPPAAPNATIPGPRPGTPPDPGPAAVTRPETSDTAGTARPAP